MKKSIRTTQSREEKKEMVYNYLCLLEMEGRKIPNLTGLSKIINNMHITTLMDILKTLDKEHKIIYHKGKILTVNITELKAETPEPVEEEKDKKTSLETKFDLAVKDVIAEYITNANITTRDEIIGYVDAIVKITDKVKNKIFKEN